VHEVQIDVEQIGLALTVAHDVVVPHLLTECPSHGDACLALTVLLFGTIIPRNET
jgi:hypothetical protein